VVAWVPASLLQRLLLLLLLLLLAAAASVMEGRDLGFETPHDRPLLLEGRQARSQTHRRRRQRQFRRRRRRRRRLGCPRR
jgi:hypothetical protein